MKIKDILNFPVFNQSKLLTGDIGITNKIESAMVLEAADIESWGAKNQLILTSFYALDNLTEEEIIDFFDKMVNIGISGLIVKMDRLIKMIPDNIIELCKSSNIALIKIPRETSYETILVSIYEPLLNKQSHVLRTYYEAHSKFISLDSMSLTFTDIADEIYTLLKKDIELQIPEKNISIYKGLNQGLDDFIEEERRSISMEFVRNEYQLISLRDQKEFNKFYAIQTTVHNRLISNIVLTIFQDKEEVRETDLMVLENAVFIIQQQLEMKYMSQRETYSRLNSLASSILHNTTFSNMEYQSFLDEAGLNKYSHYQLVGVIKDEPGKRTKKNTTLNYLKTIGLPYLYYEHEKYFIIIFNLCYEDNRLSKSSLDKYVWKSSRTDLVITNKDTKENIHKLYIEATDLINFKQRFKNYSTLSIDDLGVLGVFNHNNFKNFDKLLPEKIMQFRKEEPELFETLYIFLFNSQNYTATGDKLFIHSKTVRYRINKAKELLDIDLDNPLQILNYMLSSYLIKLNEN